MPLPEGQSTRVWSSFTLEQKAGVVFVGVLGLSGVVLGAVHIGQSLREPFVSSYTGAAFKTQSEQEALAVAEQKRADSDQDGVNDYDELSVYRTNPHLEDSDQDGTPDGQEIAAHTDPNCPDGDTCGRPADAGINNPIVATDLTGNLPFPINGLDRKVESVEDIQALLQQLTTKDIRAALVTQGIDQATVDALTDAEVTELFNGALQELSENGAFDSLAN